MQVDGAGHARGDPRQQAGARRLPRSVSMTTDTCIEFDDVVAGYGHFMILNNLSFKARRGKITLLLGPNGAGKSTVLKTLVGLLQVRLARARPDRNVITGG